MRLFLEPFAQQYDSIVTVHTWTVYWSTNPVTSLSGGSRNEPTNLERGVSSLYNSFTNAERCPYSTLNPWPGQQRQTPTTVYRREFLLAPFRPVVSGPSIDASKGRGVTHGPMSKRTLWVTNSGYHCIKIFSHLCLTFTGCTLYLLGFSFFGGFLVSLSPASSGPVKTICRPGTLSGRIRSFYFTPTRSTAPCKPWVPKSHTTPSTGHCLSTATACLRLLPVYGSPSKGVLTRPSAVSVSPSTVHERRLESKPRSPVLPVFLLHNPWGLSTWVLSHVRGGKKGYQSNRPNSTQTGPNDRPGNV